MVGGCYYFVWIADAAYARLRSLVVSFIVKNVGLGYDSEFGKH